MCSGKLHRIIGWYKALISRFTEQKQYGETPPTIHEAHIGKIKLSPFCNSRITIIVRLFLPFSSHLHKLKESSLIGFYLFGPKTCSPAQNTVAHAKGAAFSIVCVVEMRQQFSCSCDFAFQFRMKVCSTCESRRFWLLVAV